MHSFCTLFDSGYLLRGLTLYRSLRRYGDDFRLYVLCLDKAAFDIVTRAGAENIIPVDLDDVENWDRDLINVKSSRRKVEYYFTLSPILPLYILKNFNDVEIITYLDADLLFYSDPDVLYRELADKSILIIGHDYSQENEDRFRGHGKFNVEFLSFRNDEEGVGCLERWAQQCKEWCFDRVEDGKYADQAYLDEWPDRYINLVVSGNTGAGLAPWNCSKYRLSLNNSEIYVGKDKLVFYHFHGIRILSRCFISLNLKSYGVKLPGEIKANLYRRYLDEIKETYAWLGSAGIEGLGFNDRVIGKRFRLSSSRPLMERLMNLLHSLYYVC